MTAVDESILARYARVALANAVGGTLHVDGVGTSGDTTDAVFYDEGGRPTFLCATGSAVRIAAGAGRLAVLSVPAPRDDTAARLSVHAVILAGHLRVVGEEDVAGEPVSVVGLDVGSVVLELFAPDGAGVVPHSLPLAAWTSASPDPLAESAVRMVEHTNRSHGPQVRAYVASLAGVPDTQVLAAELGELDASGFVLDWIDVRGAHRLRVRFPTAARCPASLAVRLREALTG